MDDIVEKTPPDKPNQKPLYAKRRSRLGAMILDGFIIVFLLCVINIIGVLLFVGSLGFSVSINSFSLAMASMGALGFFFVATYLLLPICYFGILVNTPGKKICAIEIRRHKTFKKIGRGRAFCRVLLAKISALCFFLGHFVSLFNKKTHAIRYMCGYGRHSHQR